MIGQCCCALSLSFLSQTHVLFLFVTHYARLRLSAYLLRPVRDGFFFKTELKMLGSSSLLGVVCYIIIVAVSAHLLDHLLCSATCMSLRLGISLSILSLHCVLNSYPAPYRTGYSALLPFPLLLSSSVVLFHKGQFSLSLLSLLPTICSNKLLLFSLL